MKKIINGKLYNTDTAKLLASWDNGIYPGDFCYVEENLYIKRTGEYFIGAKGGAMTKYASRCSDGFRGAGYAAIPMSEADAQEWCADHCSTDTYIRIWGTQSE